MRFGKIFSAVIVLSLVLPPSSGQAAPASLSRRHEQGSPVADPGPASANVWHPLARATATPSNAASPDGNTAPSPAPSARLDRDWGELPLYFVENQGQLDDRVFYYLQGSDKTLYFTAEGVTFALTQPAPAKEAQPVGQREEFDADPILRTPPSESQRWTIKLEFVGANPDVRPVGEDRTEAVVSYFKGSPDEWKAGLPTYSRIVYHDLWPGIDLVYTGTVNQMKYEFIVQPGADPAQIRLAYRGATSVQVNTAGQLEVATPGGGFRDDTPVAYQDVDGQRIPVSVAYAIDESESDSANRNPEFYGFAIGPYDRTRRLVLDPALLVYCGYIGGGAYEYGRAIAVDSIGNAYVMGSTSSDQTTFPVTVGPDPAYNGNTDVFVAKVNAAGTSLVYAGYLGGARSDLGTYIAVDSAGNAYITGQTQSDQATFPVLVGPDLTYNGGRDAFVAKVNPAGTSLVYAGYIGGGADESGHAIAVDSTGNAYVAGDTQSRQDSFPVTVGPDLTFNGNTGYDNDAFVAKVNVAGTALVYAGYIGGARSDAGVGIAIDSTGNAYVMGGTTSDQATFPVTVGPDLTHNGGSDVFVAKVNWTGNSLVYAGYIGGAMEDIGSDFAVDGAGNVYVVGRSSSDQATFPVTVGPDLSYNGGLWDAFVAKVNMTGSSLVYAGYIGGAMEDSGLGLAVDGAGNVYVVGSTGSNQATFPVAAGPDLTHNGGSDAFVAKVNVAGTALVYAGYIGGAESDGGIGIDIDSTGNAYVTGDTQSRQATFPVTIGPDLTHNGDSDAFVAKVTTRYTISGRVTYPNGAPIPGILIQASYGLSATTDSYGNYSITSEVDQATFILTPSVTPSSCTTIIPEIRTVAIAQPVVSGQDFIVENIFYMLNQGNENLDAGRQYRHGFHVPEDLNLTYTQTLAELRLQKSLDQFAEAETWYRRILSCEPTNADALSRLLDTRWEKATAYLLDSNDILAQAQDIKISNPSDPLAEEIGQLQQAIGQFDLTTKTYTELLASDLHDAFLAQQPVRISPLDGQVTPYLDVQRLLLASARKSRAYLELAERQYRYATPARRGEAEQTLRRGLTQITEELALAGSLWDAIETDPSFLEALRSLSDMRRLFGYLLDNKNPFGFGPEHVPFHFQPKNLPKNNFEQAYDLAAVKVAEARRQVDNAEGRGRDFDDNWQALQERLQSAASRYDGELVRLCGMNPQGQPDMGNCHANQAGEIYRQILAIQGAMARIELAEQQMANQLALIDIEQQRAARVAGIHRATAEMFLATGQKLADLASEEARLRQRRARRIGIVNTIQSAISGASQGSAGGWWGAIAGAVLGGLSGAASNGLIWGYDEGAIPARRERLIAQQNAYVRYAEAEISDVNSEALIKQYLLRYTEYDIEHAIAMNNLQQELARLNGLRTQAEYLATQKAQTLAFTWGLFQDPGRRVLRDYYMELASDSFGVALGYAWEAGRALEYEINQEALFANGPLVRLSDLYRIRDIYTLEAALAQMDTAYHRFLSPPGEPPRVPQQRETVLYVSQLLGFEDAYDPDLRRVVTREEKLNALIRDPANRDAHGGLTLTFPTSIVLGNRNFSTAVFNDKISSIQASIMGNGLGDDRAVIHLKQAGSSTIRTLDAFKERDAQGSLMDDVRQYNVEPMTASIMAATNYNTLPPTVAVNQELGSRSVAFTNWTLRLDKQREPDNFDVSVDGIEEIVLKIAHETYTLQHLPGLADAAASARYEPSEQRAYRPIGARTLPAPAP